MAKEVIYNIQVNASVTDLVKLNEEIEQLTKAQKELTTAKNKDNEAIEKNKQQLKALKDQYSAQSKAVQNQVKEQNNLLSVYEKESQKLNQLRKDYKDQILLGNENTKATKKMAKEIATLDKRLKDVDASAGQFQRNVGNYPQKLRLATADIIKMAAATVGLDKAMGELSDGGLSTSQEGSEDLRKATSGLAAVWDNTKNAAGSYTLGLIELGKQMITGEGNIFTFRAALGKLQKGTETLKNTMDAYVSGTKVEESLIEQEKLFLDLDRAIGLLSSSLEIQQALADDNTRSLDEQIQLTEKAVQIESERNKLVIQRATSELNQVQEQIKAKEGLAGEERNLLDLRQKEVELQNALSEAEAAYISATIKGEQEIFEKRRDRYELQLDFALDVADSQKSVLERQFALEESSLEDRKVLTHRTEMLLDKSYANQIKLTEDYLKERMTKLKLSEEEQAKILTDVNIESLALLEDEEEIRNRLDAAKVIDEKVQLRILNIIRDRKAALQDVADMQSEINKIEKEHNKIIEEKKKKQIEEAFEKQMEYSKTLADQAEEEGERALQKAYEAEERKLQIKQDAKEASLNIAQELADAEFEILNANLERQKQFQLSQLQIRDEREQDLLQAKLDKGLITQAEYENNRKALAQKTEEERIKLERDAFNKKKKLDTAQAIINGALAVTKMLAAAGPASPPLVAAAIASTAIQVATIQAQKFKRGGLIQGASHEQGGVPAIVNGKRPIEVEGGEVIINKKSASMFKKELSAINQAGGGVPIFAKGGLVPKYASGGLVKAGGETSAYDLDRQARMIINGINDKRVINVVSDTVSTYSKAKQIENSVSF